MRRRIVGLLAAVLILAALAGFLLGGIALLSRRYVSLGGELHSRNSETLVLGHRALGQLEKLRELPALRQVDLRRAGASWEDYQQVCRLLPGRAVYWELELWENSYPLSTRSLVITSLTDGDVDKLDALQNLRMVDGWDCRDYAQLTELQRRHPACTVLYAVPIGDQKWDCEQTALELDGTLAGELYPALAWLPRVEQVSFTGALPEITVLEKLRQDYPQVAFSWTVTLGGRARPWDCRELDLSGQPLEDLAYIDAMLPYLPRLRELRLGDCGLPQQALMALSKGHPGVNIAWNVRVGSVSVPSDSLELDLHGTAVTPEQVIEGLELLPNVTWVDLSDTGITTEQAVALGEQFPQIRFVWTVDLGGISLRTDATWFCPNKYYMEVDDEDVYDLRYCVDMVAVDVGHMRGITNCDWAANMPKLRYLILADTNVRDISPLAGLPELRFLELFTAPVRDYTPLLELPSLEDLNLSYTYGDPTPVLKIQGLHRLWWTGSYKTITAYWRNQLKAAMPDTKMNFVTGSSTAGGWRASQNYYDMRDLMGMPYMTG